MSNPPPFNPLPYGIPYNRYVAAIGDSFTAHNTYNSVSTTNWSGSYANQYMAYGVVSWLRFLSGQAFDFDGNSNFGHFGDTTAQVLARMPAALASCNASTWFLMMGVNDFQSGSTTSTLATAQANFAAAVALLQAWGKTIIIIGQSTAGDTTYTSMAMSAQTLKLYLQYLRWIRETYTSVPGVYYADAVPAMCDPNSAAGYCIVGKTLEGLHPSPNGSFGIAMQVMPIISKLFPPRHFLINSNSDIYDATYNQTGSLYANPAMTGSGGAAGTGGSGTVAASWSGTNGGETGTARVYSVLSTTSFNGSAYPGGVTKTWQQVVYSGTSNSTVDVNCLYQAGFVPTVGQYYHMIFELEVDAGYAGFNGIPFARLYQPITSSYAAADMSHSGSQIGIGPSVAYSGIQRTPPFLAANANPVTMGITMSLINAAVSTASFRVGRCALLIDNNVAGF